MSTSTRLIRTGALEIGYEQTGPDSGQPVVLLHGFPYSVRAFDAVRDPLAASGWRVIVPHLRGYGPTRFLRKETPRSGQQAALGKDLRDLLDALKIERATVAGFDWGGRAACVAAALCPERVVGLVAMPGYDIQNIARDGVTPQPPEQEERFWYQWYFHTERGRAGLAENREALTRRLWQFWSPTWPLG
jgi:pimeloyl-ACP methyl ester carboxylesterase